VPGLSAILRAIDVNLAFFLKPLTAELDKPDPQNTQKTSHDRPKENIKRIMNTKIDPRISNRQGYYIEERPPWSHVITEEKGRGKYTRGMGRRKTE
jgi:hypothetical protein